MRSTARNNEYVVIDCSYDVSKENNNIMTTCTTYFPSLFLYPSSTSSQPYFPLTYFHISLYTSPFFHSAGFPNLFYLQVRAICVLSCSFTLIHCSPAKEDPNPFFMIQHSNHILIALAVASVANAQFIHFESPSDGMYI